METKIRELMAQTFDLPLDRIGEEMSIETVDAWTSLKHMQLVVSLEEAFDFELEEEEMLSMTTYKAICEVVRAKVG